jgi:formylmethanofuran dehydrogenase subunit B
MADDPLPTTSTRSVVANATCTECGCLCDDLTLVVEGERIVAARNGCEIGQRWFLADHSPRGLPVATVEGQAVAPEAAIDRAAEILRSARSPVVLGLNRTTNEAVGAALAIADRIGAAVEVADATALARVVAFQRVGRVSATLGEVKNRADVVVFWGADPIVTHPRHWDRYSVAPAGRFVPLGREERTVIVVDEARTATAERADLFVSVAVDRQFEVALTLRALIQGARLDPGRVERATGVAWDVLRDLTERLTSARYGAFFLGSSLGRESGAAGVEAALLLVRDMNRTTRFVILPMGSAGNAAGAEAVLTWQSGFPWGVDFAGGIPCSVPGETSALAKLERGEADAALIVGEAEFSESARAHLGRIPRVVIAPGASAIEATVGLASATSGIDAPGTVTRIDGVVLPLRPPFAPRLPTDREWLEKIAEKLRQGATR